MNAKQAARAARKLEEQAKNPPKAKAPLEQLGEVVVPEGGRENLPGRVEQKY